MNGREQARPVEKNRRAAAWKDRVIRGGIVQKEVEKTLPRHVVVIVDEEVLSAAK